MVQTKDILYIIGISSTLIISILTYFLAVKNRRNSLREHLYKEQFNFFIKIMTSIHMLNMEVQALINDSSKRHENEFDKLLSNVVDIYTISEFIPPEYIRGKCHNLIFKAEQYYSCFLTADFAVYGKAYNNYYDVYSELVNSIKDYLGTQKLSKENLQLHSSNNTMQKLASELKERILKSNFGIETK
jgi:hypothetical protein